MALRTDPRPEVHDLESFMVITTLYRRASPSAVVIMPLHDPRQKQKTSMTVSSS